MTTLSLLEKLQFLWDDFLSFVNTGIRENKYPKEILDNFTLIDKSQINKINDNAKYNVSCGSCESNCCSRIDGKILLTLKDIAVLIDNGHENSIEGSFRGFATLLKDYQENRDNSVFNDVSRLMQDMLNNEYMPYLKKIGSACVFMSESGLCKVYDIRPVSCKMYPYHYDASGKEIVWLNNCQSKSKNMSEEDKDRVVSNIAEFENERIKDISLVMLNIENLGKIGYKDYL
ncbi:MAG: hypothetical protein A2Y40_08210 [Candidatus Margulisbacteria bacterium GWF2_35_9]|nr:MAG: hypothetical protein A2Y40_08210 [Candidatus Margulisbacteria bacterium GWF2_35_9]